MRSPQFGKWHKGHKRSNNAALPVVERPLAVAYGLGRTAPPKDKPRSRNDHRVYHWGGGKLRGVALTPQGKFTLRS